MNNLHDEIKQIDEMMSQLMAEQDVNIKYQKELNALTDKMINELNIKINKLKKELKEYDSNEIVNINDEKAEKLYNDYVKLLIIRDELIQSIEIGDEIIAEEDLGMSSPIMPYTGKKLGEIINES